MPALDRDRLATSTKRRGKTATGRPAHQVHYSAEAQQRRQLKLGDGDGIVLPTGDHRQVQKSPEPPTSAKQSKNATTSLRSVLFCHSVIWTIFLFRC